MRLFLNLKALDSYSFLIDVQCDFINGNIFLWQLADFGCISLVVLELKKLFEESEAI